MTGHDGTDDEREDAEPLDNPLSAWAALGAGAGWVYSIAADGAQAYDSAEGVLYRAQIDGYGRLVAVTVIVPADRMGARLDMERAARTLAEFAAAASPDRGVTPSWPEVADMLAAGLGRQQIAERYGRSLRTVDKWIATARKQYPDRVPPVTRGRPKASEEFQDLENRLVANIYMQQHEHGHEREREHEAERASILHGMRALVDSASAATPSATAEGQPGESPQSEEENRS